MFVPFKHNSSYEFEKVRVDQGDIEFYRTVFDDFDPDIVALHAPHYLTVKNNVQNLSKRNTPFVIWIHGSEALFHTLIPGYIDPFDIKSKLYSVISDPLKIVLLRHLFLKSNAVVYVSKWMKTITERQLLFKHPFSAVIPNPVDTELFRFKIKDEEAMCKGLAVRNLGWKYGLDIAIRAYSKLDKTHLTIYGSGALENYLRVLAQKCQSNVSFITKPVNHDNMPEIYHRFGYFVAPSRVEAQGLAMCEAMACGLPVITTNVGGIPEFVKNEVNGLIISPEKPLILRKTIKRLLREKQLYSSLSEQGAKFVKEKLSPKAICGKEYSILKTCIEENKT